jgi:hypothetical protein
LIGARDGDSLRLACYRLAYASQQESAHLRGLWKAQKIRMRLGGSASMLDHFPEKPKGMHWLTYERFAAYMVQHKRVQPSD